MTTATHRRRPIGALLGAVLILAGLLPASLASPAPAAAVSTTVVISEFRVRGPNGAADEFVELHNLSDAPVPIGGWTMRGSNSSGTTSVRATIAAGATLNPGCFYLLGNSSTSGGPYSGSVAADQTFATGITDDGGIAIVAADGATIVDQVGMSTGSAYKEGTPLSSLGGSNLDRGYERKPGGAAGHAMDTDDNAADFQLITPSNPQSSASRCIGSPVINEFVLNHVGTDTHEYVEVFGAPGEDYSAYSILQIEGDTTGSGVIDSVHGVGTTDAGGYWTTGFLTNIFENGTLTLLLVKDFSGAVGNDLDTNNDGVFDVTPWSAITDGVAVSDGGVGDLTYAVPVLAPGFGGSPFTPGGASRIPNGRDTDSVSDWTVNDFDGEGLPGFTGTLVEGEALNTPGAVNRTLEDLPPTVVSTTPADGASGVAVNQTISVTFSEEVTLEADAITLTCDPEGPDASVGSGPDTTFSLLLLADLPAGAECSVEIVGSKVLDTDGTPTAMAADYSWSFTTAGGDPCADPFTPIYSIQGSGSAAAITGTVTTSGVVIGDYEGPSPALRGFYIQDPVGDGDPATSDGIFVFNGNNDNVSLGDLVRVTGSAADFQDQTQISASSVLACGTGSVDPVDVTLPFASASYLERYEGMLVRLAQTLYVTEHFQLGRFGQVVMSSGDRLSQPTNVVAPGAPAQALQLANNLNRIIVDDALNNQNPDPILFGRDGLPLSASNTLRGGDTATGIVGVMTYTWAGNAASGNAYRVRPINALGGGIPEFEPTNPRPATPPDVGGDLRVAALNLLNYFNTFSGCTNGVGGAPTDCRGAENAFEFERQATKTVTAIAAMDVDVLGIIEIENDGYGPDSAIQDLVDRLNAATAPGTYSFVDADAGTGQVNSLGTDAIKVGFLYQPAAVTLVGSTAALNTAAFVNGGDSVARNRPALAQAFQTASGARFVATVNHLKSKGSACDAPDAGDGQGNCNDVRTAAAELLADWLATDPTGARDADILILGDLNSYAKEDPIASLESAGYTNLISGHIGPDAYSYVFDGQWGYLDHAMASPSLLSQVAGVAEWHVNADEPSVLDYNTNFKSAGQIVSLYAPDQFRVSDHDPVIVGLNLTSLGFGGLEPPVAEAPALNTAKAGSTVAVNFELSGYLGLDVLFGLPVTAEIDCTTRATIGGYTTASSPGSGGLDFDPETGEYTFAWKTSKPWAGTCRTFVITLDDGSFARADFQFVK